MPVSFHFQNFSEKIKNKKRLVDWLLAVAFIEQRRIEKIDFVFCDDQFLLSLNKKFLHHKTLTDIITFDYSERDKLIAEIYISTEHVKENSTYFNVRYEDELHRVMIHGVLHCIGYSDKTEKDKNKMRRKEDEYLKLLREMK